MASDPMLSGTRFRVYDRSTGADVFLCDAITKTTTKTNSVEKNPRYDKDDVTAVPWEFGLKTSRAMALNFSGKMSAANLAKLRAMDDSEDSTSLKLLVDKPLASGGGDWTGNFHMESLQIQSQNNGVVEFTAQLSNDGPVVWTDAAA